MLKNAGVEDDVSAPYKPNENGRAERQNRKLLNSIRAMLQHARLPKPFWAEALQVAVHIRNMVLKSNWNASPFEGLYGIKPSAETLVTFGCEVFCRVADVVRKKLDPKSVKAIPMRVISYEKYRVYLVEERRFTTIRYARINEASFPARNWNSKDTVDRHFQDAEYTAEDDTESEFNYIIESDWDDSSASAESRIRDDATASSVNMTDQVNEETEEPPRYPRRERRAPNEWWRTDTQEAALRMNDGNEDPLSYEQAIQGPDAEKWVEAVNL